MPTLPAHTMLTLDQYDALVTALRQRLNRRRVGRYRRLGLMEIRRRIDTALCPPDDYAVPHSPPGAEGQSLGHACDQCGACCRQLGISIFQTDIDREPRLAGVVKEENVTPADGSDGRRLFSLAQVTACPMQDGNRCTIQATKPDVCRATPAGSFCCQYSRRQEGLPALRPAG